MSGTSGRSASERPFPAISVLLGVIALVGLIASFRGVVWVAVWFAVTIAYFGLVGRKTLILSPEEDFALEHQVKA